MNNQLPKKCRLFPIVVIPILFCLQQTTTAQSTAPGEVIDSTPQSQSDDQVESSRMIDDLDTQIDSDEELTDEQKSDLKQRLYRAKQALANAAALASKTAGFKKQAAGDTAGKITALTVKLNQFEETPRESP